MNNNNGSCLNKECTEAVEKIYKNLKEARDLFKSLPNCIRAVKSEYEKNDGYPMHFILDAGEKSARFFAKEFGIDIEE